MCGFITRARSGDSGAFNKTEARDFYERAKQEQQTGRFFPELFQQGGYAKLEEVLDGYLAAYTGRSKRDEVHSGSNGSPSFQGHD